MDVHRVVREDLAEDGAAAGNGLLVEQVDTLQSARARMPAAFRTVGAMSIALAGRSQIRGATLPGQRTRIGVLSPPS